MTAESNDKLIDLAMDYAMGALGSDAMEAFEARLIAGDAAYVAEFERVRAAGDAFLRGLPESEPDMIERSDLINATKPPREPAPFAEGNDEPDSFAENAAAMVLMRGGEIDWKDTPVPGVRARNLFVDRERGRLTVLLKLDPGVVYPDHDHDGVEECLVLEGDLELGGKTLRAMDYIRIPKGGQHGTPRTTSGCTLLVISPLTEAA